MRSCRSPAASCSCAAATTATPPATRRTFRASNASPGASSTRRNGPRTSTMRTSAWWSSAAAPPRSPWCRSWRGAPPTSRCCNARRPMSWRGRRWTASRLCCAAPCRRNLPTPSRAGKTCSTACTFSACAGANRSLRRRASWPASAPNWDRITTSRPTSRRATTPGSSACAWCRMATSSRRSRTAARRSSPIRSKPSPRRGSSSPPGTNWWPT